MKKMFKLLIGCFVLIVLLLVLSACIIFFFWQKIWDRVAPWFGAEPGTNISNTNAGNGIVKLPSLPDLTDYKY